MWESPMHLCDIARILATNFQNPSSSKSVSRGRHHNPQIVRWTSEFHVIGRCVRIKHAISAPHPNNQHRQSPRNQHSQSQHHPADYSQPPPRSPLGIGWSHVGVGKGGSSDPTMVCPLPVDRLGVAASSNKGPRGTRLGKSYGDAV